MLESVLLFSLISNFAVYNDKNKRQWSLNSAKSAIILILIEIVWEKENIRVFISYSVRWQDQDGSILPSVGKLFLERKMWTLFEMCHKEEIYPLAMSCQVDFDCTAPIYHHTYRLILTAISPLFCACSNLALYCIALRDHYLHFKCVFHCFLI